MTLRTTIVSFFEFKKKSILFFGIVFYVGSIFLCACSNNPTRQDKMVQEGNEIVEKIESYKQQNNKLPENLNDLGLEEKDGYNVIYYTKRDSCNFTISFPISEESHMFYYSDSKKWEEGYRKM